MIDKCGPTGNLKTISRNNSNAFFSIKFEERVDVWHSKILQIKFDNGIATSVAAWKSNNFCEGKIRGSSFKISSNTVLKADKPISNPGWFNSTTIDKTGWSDADDAHIAASTCSILDLTKVDIFILDKVCKIQFVK